MGYIKVFAQWRWRRRSSDHNSLAFSSKQTSLIYRHIPYSKYARRENVDDLRIKLNCLNKWQRK